MHLQFTHADCCQLILAHWCGPRAARACRGIHQAALLSKRLSPRSRLRGSARSKVYRSKICP